MSDEGESYFWKYIENMQAKHFDFQSDMTQRKLYEFAVIGAKEVLSVAEDSPKIKLLKFSLSLRMYSPKIEMFQQVNLSVTFSVV